MLFWGGWGGSSGRRIKGVSKGIWDEVWVLVWMAWWWRWMWSRKVPRIGRKRWG